MGLTSVIILFKLVLLDLSAHGTVKDDDSFSEYFAKVGPESVDV